MTFADPPKRRFQSPAPNTTTGAAPTTSSSARNVLPNTGLTSRVWKKPAETM